MKAKKILSAFLASIMLISATPAVFAEENVMENSEVVMSDAEAVEAVYNEFSKSEYGKISSPLLFPIEYNGTVYDNAVSYLKAWAYDKTGRDIDVSFTPYIYTTTYKDWSTGSLREVTYDGMDINGDIIQDYFTNNAKKTLNRLDNVTFSLGEAVSKKINKIYVPVASLERTPSEIVEYASEQFPFERIKNTNSEPDKVVAALGEKSGSSVSLPTASGLYNTTVISVSWSAENISGDKSALKISSGKTTVTRPNVGEEDAVFDLIAKIKSKADTDITSNVVHRITVPAFEECKIPLLVPTGAKVNITDSYYKKAVADKYIVKQDTAPEGYDLYICSLHTAATGIAQKYNLSVSKEGFITKTTEISVEESINAPYKISLIESSEDDTKLNSLEITSQNSTKITFDKAITEYEVEAAGQYISINAQAATEGAEVKVTSYYSSLTNANNGKTASKVMPKTGLNCYLPDKQGETIIKITVTAPEGSVEDNTREYIIKVKKNVDNGVLTALTVKATSTMGAAVDKNADKCNGVAEEEVLTPSFVPGMGETDYNYNVNYGRNQITVTAKADSAYALDVNGTPITSGKQSEPIDLEVGENKITVTATCGDKSEKYVINVRRKALLYITDIELEGKCTTEFTPINRTGSCIYDYDAEKINLKVITNTEEACDIAVLTGDTWYYGTSGSGIEIPVSGKDSIIAYICISHTVDGIREGQTYVVGLDRGQGYSPNAVESYLPAPGQFVNLKSSWGNPEQTLSGSAGITLGAFGGNVVYRYDTPIKNDPKNPYGIDFIVYGNCFTDTDGGTSSGAAEPGAVAVSADGEVWYELAGSEYYTRSAKKNVLITYKNTDTTFEKAVEVPWTDNYGGSGTMPVVNVHPQNYFPNPDNYGKYQKGAGKNNTYTAQEATYGGTMIDYGFYPFGYADSHSAKSELKNHAQNPYVENHRMNYNGDGFDISWAVDGDGNPVKLDEIKYIKIYNPVLSYGSSRGEISPEIQSVSYAEPDDREVGKSGGLSRLTINGDNVELTSGVYTYTMDAKGAASFKITPETENADANIYVSNKRVKSGSVSAPIESVEKLRIIVQEDKKEPQIYIINFTNVPDEIVSAELSSLTLTPGDVESFVGEDSSFTFNVSSEVSKIRFTPIMPDKKAKAVFVDAAISGNEPIASGEMSETITVLPGENNFKIKVSSGDEVKEYSITVNRAKPSGGGSTQDNITVKFSLTGDSVHYDKDTGTYTDSHNPKNMISERKVTIPTGSTVKYLTEMMLNNAGISYTSDGVYVSEIDGLGELDNGPNSGWMYRVNGTIFDVSYATKVIESGDVIKWFYTDDYTKETGYEGGWDNVNGGSSGGGSSKKDESGEKAENDKKNEQKENTEKPKEHRFGDISGHWSEKAAKYVFERGLMVGTDEEHFEPDAYMTRAMFAAVLFRIEGMPKVTAENKFTDVLSGTWYTDAVLWAAEKGIAGGFGDGSFAPDAELSREQLAVIICNWLKYRDINLENAASLDGFSDAGKVSAWAAEAMSKAIGAGIISGMGDAMLSPEQNATRGQVAMILMRIFEEMKILEN